MRERVGDNFNNYFYFNYLLNKKNIDLSKNEIFIRPHLMSILKKNITNKEIASHLKLPPVKLHCSMLAEDAIKSAIEDYKKKNKKT